MRTVTTPLYHFDELPTEKAKEKAREWWRDQTDGYQHGNETVESLYAFIRYFGGKLLDWRFSSNRVECFVTTDGVEEDEDNFVGIDTYITDRGLMPTGYYLDCDLWTTFYEKVREHGSPVRAFDAAISAALDTVSEDIEYQESDEYIDETLTMNDYEFTEDGKLYVLHITT